MQNPIHENNPKHTVIMIESSGTDLVSYAISVLSFDP
jgi:hypothetical protein